MLTAVGTYFMAAEIKQIIVLLLESVDDVLVLLHDLLDALNAQILDALRLVDQLHQLDDLLQPLCERVELAEDVVLAAIDAHHGHMQ